MPDNRTFQTRPRRLSWPLIAGIVLLHLAALYGLARALAPDFTASVEREVLSTFTVTITDDAGQRALRLRCCFQIERIDNRWRIRRNGYVCRKWVTERDAASGRKPVFSHCQRPFDANVIIPVNRRCSA